MRAVLHRKVLRIGLLVVFAGLVASLIIFREQLDFERLKGWGYPGVFLLALVGSTATVLPIPHLGFTTAMGSVLDPWWVGLAGGTGDAIGALMGYLAGHAVEDVADRWKFYPTVERWMRTNGDLTVFLMNLVPIPVYNTPGIAAGVTGYPAMRLILMTWLGKTLKAVLCAWGGHYGISWVLRLVGLGG
ncbi:MAG: hypothetical protein DRI37_00710 [Chloroflexi bacterium]|nr:MAG: hypothetical protein DRI37_00710 [Chloroflexota bacterium]